MDKLKAKLTKAGDVKIEQVVIITSTGVAQDITLQTIGFDIYEDLFSPFMSGVLYVRDSQKLAEILPLVGEETVYVRISTPEMPSGTDFNQRFAIYKMEGRVATSEREACYSLRFVSRESLVDLNQQVSRAFSGPVHEIVDGLLKSDYGLLTTKTCNIEKTQNKTKFVANFWPPIRCLQYAAETAVTETDSPSFIFFENKYGFNFVSLESLYGEEAIFEFVKDNYTNMVNKSGGSSKNLAEDYRRILELRQPIVFDYMERLKGGLYGSEIIYMDLLTGQYVHKAYSPEFEGKHLNEFPLFSKSVSAHAKGCLIRDSQCYNVFDKYEADTANTKIHQKRLHLLAAAQANKCTIKVFGRTDYAAGQKISLKIPKAAQILKDDPEWMDKVVSGHYLISSVCHSITKTEYFCTMEIIKDSYMIDLNTVNV